MEQYAEFSYALPVKMYPLDGTNTHHLDDNWAKNRLLPFQRNTTYPQRWQIGDTTGFQLSSTIVPDDLQVQDCDGNVLFTIAWVQKLAYSGVKVYECTLNLDAAGNDKEVFLYQKVEMLETVFEFMSEKIRVQTVWPNTRVFEYTNKFNTYSIYFITGIKFKFRIEAAVMDYQPNSEASDFIDELHDTTLLSATPYDTFKLYIGDAAGVADWAVKLLNYIVHCTNWKIEDKQYAKVSNDKWELTRVKNYPLYGASIDITPATNLTSAQLNAIAFKAGIVTGYLLETNFFGTSVTQVQVEEINIIN